MAISCRTTLINLICNISECGGTGTSFCAECSATACTKCTSAAYYIDGTDCKGMHEYIDTRKMKLVTSNIGCYLF